jgi:hypothetical protein
MRKKIKTRFNIHYVYVIIDGFDGPHYFKHCSTEINVNEIALKLFKEIVAYCETLDYIMVENHLYYDDNYNTCLEVVFESSIHKSILGNLRKRTYKYVIYDKEY